MIRELVGRLGQAGFELSVTELRQALWLASFLPKVDAAAPVAETPGGAAAPLETSPPAAPPAERIASGEKPPVPLHYRDVAIERHGQRYFAPAPRPEGRAASSIRVPGVRTLPQAAAIMRSLRPLTRKRPTWREAFIDEEATVAAFSETGLFTPMYAPGRGKWWDLALVVEDTPSMSLWRDPVDELEALMRRLGAFRKVARWTLTPREDELWLTRGAVLTHGPAELMDREGHRLVLLLTDCTSPVWYTDRMHQFCGEIGAVSSIAVLQVLPDQHWPATGLGGAEVALSAITPGTPNQKLSVHRGWWLEGDELPAPVPMPVVSWSPESLAPWARLLAGEGGGRARGVLLYPFDGPMRPAKAPSSARERIEVFRARSSTQAYRLAIALSAMSPLTIAVMQLVQRSLFADTGPQALAEVFVGGLLKIDKRFAPPTPAAVVYDFDDDVRELLVDNVERSQVARMREIVGDYMAQALGYTGQVRALLDDPEGTERIGEAARPFAETIRRLNRRLGSAAMQGTARELQIGRGITVRHVSELGDAATHMLFVDDNQLAVVTERGALYTLLAHDRSPSGPTTMLQFGEVLALGATGNDPAPELRVVFARGHREIHLYDVERSEVIGVFARPRAMAFGTSGEFALVEENGDLRVVWPRPLKPQFVAKTRGEALALAWSPDASKLALVRSLREARGQALWIVPVHAVEPAAKRKPKRAVKKPSSSKKRAK